MIDRRMRVSAPAGAVVAFGLAVGAASFAPTEAAAQSISCGGSYQVRAGDTLSEIAVRAYGAGRFGPIFEANRNRMSSPQRLEVGVTLFIPCLDGRGQPLPEGVRPESALTQAEAPSRTPDIEEAPVETAALAAPTDTPTFRTAPNALSAAIIGQVPEGQTVRLLAVNPSAPFVGYDLPEGGMLTEVVQRALYRSPVLLDFDVTYRGGETLTDVAGGGFDLGFPVRRPNCESPTLPADAEAVCADYFFSSAIYTTGISMYVTTTGDFVDASQASDLQGARLCRPEGMAINDLQASGLTSGYVSLVRARDTVECFLLLTNGDVGVVSVSPEEGEAAMELMDDTRRIARIDNIGEGQAVHVAAPRSAPLAQAYIEIINEGLSEMRSSGEYDAVVQNHLTFARMN
ncbi:MAG: LysM peptidoglycan-binding domain-containing protein [Pseudomonadota bacterium]